jgi:hypothetical protein
MGDITLGGRPRAAAGSAEERLLRRRGRRGRRRPRAREVTAVTWDRDQGHVRCPGGVQPHAPGRVAQSGQSASLTTTRSQVRALSRPPANTAGQRAKTPPCRDRAAAPLPPGPRRAARTHDPPPLAAQIASRPPFGPAAPRLSPGTRPHPSR